MSAETNDIQIIPELLKTAQEKARGGDKAAAIADLKNALGLIESTHTESAFIADCLRSLAESHFALKEYRESAEYDERLVDWLDKTPTPNLRNKVVSLMRMAEGHQNMGYSVKAADYFRSAAETAEQALPSDDPLRTKALQAHAAMLEESGADKKALRAVQEKLETSSQTVGKLSLSHAVPAFKPSQARIGDFQSAEDKVMQSPEAIQEARADRENLRRSSASLRKKQISSGNGMGGILPMLFVFIVMIAMGAFLLLQLHR